MLCHFEVSQNKDLWFTLPPTESQNRDLWFTLPPQRSLLVLWLFSAIPIPILKFPIFIHLVCVLFINSVMDYEEDCCELCNFAFCIVTPSTFQYTHETDQIAMCIQTESLLI